MSPAGLKRSPASATCAGSPSYRAHDSVAVSEAGRRAQAAQARAWLDDLAPVLDELRAAGVTILGRIAAALNARHSGCAGPGLDSHTGAAGAIPAAGHGS
jgi:hypothetical protein